MIRSRLCNKTSCDLVRSCLCRVDRETAARDVIKLLLTEPDRRPSRSHVRRTRKMAQLTCNVGLYQSPASESLIIYRCRGNNLLHQMGIDMLQHGSSSSNGQQSDSSAINTNKPTAVQLAVVLLKLREQLPSFFNGHHDFNLYSSNVCFEYSVGKQLPLVMVGKQRYKMFTETFRRVTNIVWTSPKLEVLKITKVIDNGTIECRWRVSGRLRGMFGKGKERILYDAFSTFTVDLDGLISKHKLQKFCEVILGREICENFIPQKLTTAYVVMPQPTVVKARPSWWDHLLTRVTARTTN